MDDEEFWEAQHGRPQREITRNYHKAMGAQRIEDARIAQQELDWSQRGVPDHAPDTPPPTRSTPRSIQQIYERFQQLINVPARDRDRAPRRQLLTDKLADHDNTHHS